jgi:hypothetical protein
MRRRTLGLGVVMLAATIAAAAAPPAGPGLQFAHLKYGGGGDWYGDATSLRNLARALAERTTIPIAREREENLALMDEELFDYPFLFMNGHGTVRLTDAEAERLRRYLLEGGFLFADDDYGLDASFRIAMRRVFPDRPLVEVPFDHPIYHAFYDVPNGPPKIHEHDGQPAQGFGIFDRGRLVVFYTHEADIGDGLEDPEVHHDPPEKREAALRMAINVVVYALTGGASKSVEGLPVS